MTKRHEARRPDKERSEPRLDGRDLTPEEIGAVLAWPWRPFAAPSTVELDEVRRLKEVGELPDGDLYEWQQRCPRIGDLRRYAAERIYARGHRGTIRQVGGVEKLVWPILRRHPRWNITEPDWDVLGSILTDDCGVDPGRLPTLTLPDIRSYLGGRHQAAPESDGGGFAFRRSGDVWTVRFEGEGGQFGDSKGMTYLHRLLGRRDPRKPLSPDDLRGVPAERATPDAPSEGVLDREALAQVRRTLANLDERIRDAAARGLASEADRLSTERAKLQRARDDAFDPAGRVRPLNVSDLKKSSDAIQKALSRTYGRLADGGMHKLARHFEAFVVREGLSFAYRPSPAPAWET